MHFALLYKPDEDVLETLVVIECFGLIFTTLLVTNLLFFLFIFTSFFTQSKAIKS